MTAAKLIKKSVHANKYCPYFRFADKFQAWRIIFMPSHNRPQGHTRPFATDYTDLHGPWVHIQSHNLCRPVWSVAKEKTLHLPRCERPQNDGGGWRCEIRDSQGHLQAADYQRYISGGLTRPPFARPLRRRGNLVTPSRHCHGGVATMSARRVE